MTVTEPAAGNWDTALSVTNPAYADEMADGGLTFTFYGQDVMTEPPMFQTSAGSPGTGLSDDGTLPAGGTYQVMASQILDATDWGTRFVGHVYVLADYTNCSGVGWVTDFMGVNQAYSATVIDADTGTDKPITAPLCRIGARAVHQQEAPLMDAFGGLFAFSSRLPGRWFRLLSLTGKVPRAFSFLGRGLAWQKALPEVMTGGRFFLQ